MSLEIYTPNRESFVFFPIKSDGIRFKVKASNDAHVMLSTGPAVENPNYLIVIGAGQNTTTDIRKNKDHQVATVPSPGIISNNHFKEFWLSFEEGRIICLGHEDNSLPIIAYTDSDPQTFKYIGISTGWGATGAWVFEPSDRLKWVPASNGHIPLNAFLGADDNSKKTYVARAWHNYVLTPGKLLLGDKCVYVGWGHKEYWYDQYEVLCNFNGFWQKWKNGYNPSNAIPAGKSEVGETLFVGRVRHNGEVVVGKVHPKDNYCLIPYCGKEHKYTEFEVLVSKDISNPVSS